MYKNKSKAVLVFVLTAIMCLSGFAVLGSIPTASATTSSPTYAVEFQEYGLSSGVPWSATLNGSTQISETNTTVFNMPNGTYAFTIKTGSGYTASVSSGNAIVSGKKVFENTTFSALTYAITFDVALPAGTYLVVNNIPSAIGATNPVFDLANGTYNYYIDFQGSTSYKPVSGTVYVNGAALSKTLTLMAIPAVPTYSVIFAESGLPAASYFNVSIYTSTANVTGPMQIGAKNAATVAESLANGTYTYYAWTNITGDYSIAEYGSFSVSGNSKVLPSMAFTTGGYAVSFSESGLGANAPYFGISFDSMTRWGGSGAALVFNVPSGTYSFSVLSIPEYTFTPSSGSIAVSAATAETITYKASPVYTVTFTESGLAPGLTWYVDTPGNVGGPNNYNSSTNTQIIFAGPNFAYENGTYNYAIGAPAGYKSSPSSGSFTVNGKTIIINIGFSSDVFSVAFSPKTIGAWSYFNVTYNGFTLSAKDSSVNFEVLNGNYTYSIAGVTGFVLSGSATGYVVVNGSAITKTITFTPVKYAVTFTETGLTSGANWSLTMGGKLYYSTTSSIVVNEPNGNWNYNISTLENFELLQVKIGNNIYGITGSVSVDNATVSVSVIFGEVFSTTFVETGLPSGTTWTVNVQQNGNTVTTLSGTGLSLSWDLLNGTYVYSVNGVNGYTISSGGSGGFVVSGKSVVEAVAFAPITPSATYSVTFSETGLASGTAWSVVFNGNTYSSTTSSITIQSVVPGTYSYSVGAVKNFTMSPSSGSVIVVQSNIGNVITFSPVGTGIIGSGHQVWQTLQSNWMIVVGIILFIGIVFIVADVSMHGGKKSRKRMR